MTTRSYRCYHREFNPEPLHFNHLEGDRVAAVHEEASLNDNERRNAIYHWSLIPRGRITRGSVPQILRYIYAPPQKRPRSGDGKQILPLTGYAETLARVCMPEWSPIGDWGLGVVSWTSTLRHGDSNTSPKTTKYITWGTSLTRVPPPKRRLGPGMCWDDAYAKINRMSP